MSEENVSNAEEQLQETEEKNYLLNTWVFWILIADLPSVNWQEAQQFMNEFQTVEEFFRLHNNIHAPSKLYFADYSYFKKGIHPYWEDEKLKYGGRWVVRFEKVRGQTLDELLLTTLLACIGGELNVEGEDCIAGVVVSARSKASKISIWMTEANEASISKIGRQFWDIIYRSEHRIKLVFESFYLKKKETHTISVDHQSIIVTNLNGEFDKLVAEKKLAEAQTPPLSEEVKSELVT